MSKWKRVRFKSDADDIRPIYKPPANPEGPWWCSGEAGDGSYSILIAYVKSIDTLMKQWPEAKELDIEEVEKPTFSGRFPKPDWWKDE